MRVLTCATSAAGCLLGTALHAVGEGEEEREALKKQLRELQILAAKVALEEPFEADGMPPPGDARGGVPLEVVFFPVALPFTNTSAPDGFWKSFSPTAGTMARK